MPLILRDKEIREIFYLFHNNKFPSCKLIQELRVNNGNAIADLVSIGKTTHCYEIKSDTDNIYRAIKQSKSYDFSFNKITLITTKNNISKALMLLPNYWGIISIERCPTIKIKYIRKAIASPFYSLRSALNILWKEEMISYIHEMNIKNVNSKLNREKLIEIILKNNNKDQIMCLIASSLRTRDEKYKKIIWKLEN